MIETWSQPATWVSLATLSAMEIVLGIDNVIFIAILVDKLPRAQRELARRIGLGMAMFMRIGLLFVLAWVIGLVAPLFSALGHEISGRDLILIAGGLFLLWKSVGEIHQLLEGEEGARSLAVRATFGPIGRFVSAHPSIKMLALAFLVVIGVVLIAAGFDHEVPKGYVYFAMAFSVAVELLNIRMRRRGARPVHLHEPYAPQERDR